MIVISNGEITTLLCFCGGAGPARKDGGSICWGKKGFREFIQI